MKNNLRMQLQFLTFCNQGIQGTSDGDYIAQQCLMITSSSKIGMTGHVLKMLVLQLGGIRLKTCKNMAKNR